MSSPTSALDDHLWPHVGTVLGRLDAAGVAIGVVSGPDVAFRCFGPRHVGTGAPVTEETMFSLASVSKPFVATAVMTLASRGQVDLDAPITDHVPELSLADGRAAEVTPRGLLAHTSGLGDVSDYGWHDPQLGDDALAVLAAGLSDRRLEHEQGTFHYSNLGYELLGLLVSRVAGTTFEDAMKTLVLEPAGMTRSTFLRADVPAELAASPHVGMPLAVPGDAYPYTRRHAPSSSLHSNLVELCRWMRGLVDPVDAELVARMSEPVVPLDDPPWEESQSLGFGVGTWREHRLITHSGMDPGFRSLFVVVPERRLGVVVLGNSNTIPAYRITDATLEVAADGKEGAAVEELLTTMRIHAGPVAAVLAREGPAAAAAEYHRLLTADPPEVDLEWDGFEDSVWGAIELHRTELVWPLLRLWTELVPDSSPAWTMTGWAQSMDGEPALARTALERALELDADNEDAALILGNL